MLSQFVCFLSERLQFINHYLHIHSFLFSKFKFPYDGLGDSSYINAHRYHFQFERIGICLSCSLAFLFLLQNHSKKGCNKNFVKLFLHDNVIQSVFQVQQWNCSFDVIVANILFYHCPINKNAIFFKTVCSFIYPFLTKCKIFLGRRE